MLRGLQLARTFLGASSGSGSIAAMVQAAALQYGVDPQLALAVAQRESGLNPNATSSAGAQGVMQLMPATAASLGVANPYDPTQNIPAGVRYLASLLSSYGGDVTKAVAAYNWGPTNLNRAIAQYGGNWLSVAPAETQSYVQAITGVTAESNAPTPALQLPSADTAPLTIDASTGEILDPTALQSVDFSNPMVYGGLAVGALLLFSFLRR